MFSIFKEALGAIDRVYSLSGVTKTPNGVLIRGPSGTGKSTLVRYFIESLPRSSLFEAAVDVIYIRLRSASSAGSVITATLSALKYPWPGVRGGAMYLKRDVTLQALKQKGTKLICVDEAHNLAPPLRGRARKDDEPPGCDVLREFMDDAKVGLVLCANRDFDLEEVDPALAARVPTRHDFENFAGGTPWVAFILAFAEVCRSVVDLNLLKVDPNPIKLHLAASGNLRSFKRLVTEFVLVAIDAGKDRVDEKDLCSGFDRVYGNASPVVNPWAPVASVAISTSMGSTMRAKP